MYYQHARTFSLYPLIPYWHVLVRTIAGGAVKVILLIGTTIDMTHWRYLIQGWSSCKYQIWRRYGAHFFPLLRKCRILVIKQQAHGMMCSAWLSFSMGDYEFCEPNFVEAKDFLMFSIKVT